jgi:hypothetical protein
MDSKVNGNPKGFGKVRLTLPVGLLVALVAFGGGGWYAIQQSSSGALPVSNAQVNATTSNLSLSNTTLASYAMGPSNAAASTSGTGYSPYLGNDNAEFGTYPTGPQIASAHMTITTNLLFIEPNNPNCFFTGSHCISLQYNPDLSMSRTYQTNHDWFQAIIAVNNNNCFWFTIQIWGASLTTPVWQSYWPGGQSPATCSSSNTLNGILNAKATWHIVETVNQKTNVIDSVNFGVQAGGKVISHTISGWPSTYQWIQSSLCLCGGPGLNALFWAGAGTFTYSASPNIIVDYFAPPSPPSTSENSNVQYGCMQGAGTSSMSQSFSLGGKC